DPQQVRVTHLAGELEDPAEVRALLVGLHQVGVDALERDLHPELAVLHPEDPAQRTGAQDLPHLETAGDLRALGIGRGIGGAARTGRTGAGLLDGLRQVPPAGGAGLTGVGGMAATAIAEQATIFLERFPPRDGRAAPVGPLGPGSADPMWVQVLLSLPHPWTQGSRATCHRPVEPKPPSPRALSGRVSTSSSTTRRTGAITSWAMRSPRRSVMGSCPRLISSTCTSPRKSASTVPGLLRQVSPSRSARPERGRICPSWPSGMASARPVGMRARAPGAS